MTLGGREKRENVLLSNNFIFYYFFMPAIVALNANIKS